MSDENSEYIIYQLSHLDLEQIKHLALFENNPQAQVALGYCYENGINGASKNPEEAFRLYEMAAFQGESNGIYNVGVCLGFGIGTGKDRDPQGWLSNIKRAALLGFAPAQNDYGWAFECAKDRGFFDVKDEKQAFQWYLKSAEQNHKTGITNVIRCYTEGIGTPKDLEAANIWQKKLDNL